MDYSKDVYQMVTVEGMDRDLTTNLDILVALLASITDDEGLTLEDDVIQ